MSQWTHINAVIRFDVIRPMGMRLPNLGNTCDYDDDAVKWDACTVPKGSEGSMQYHIWESPDESRMASYTVMFWGDLRDYDNRDEIMEYFEIITSGGMTRSGLLEINVEGSHPEVFRFSDDFPGKWIPLTEK